MKAVTGMAAKILSALRLRKTSEVRPRQSEQIKRAARAPKTPKPVPVAKR